MKIATTAMSILMILFAMSCKQKETEPQAQNSGPQSTAPAQQQAPAQPSLK